MKSVDAFFSGSNRWTSRGIGKPGELIVWVFHREEKRVYPQIAQIYTEVRKPDLENEMRLPKAKENLELRKSGAKNIYDFIVGGDFPKVRFFEKNTLAPSFPEFLSFR